MLEIRVAIDNIDYDSAIDILFPYISDKLEERLANKNPVKEMLSKLINRQQDFNKDVVKGLIKLMPDEKKEELITWCINSKPTEVAKFIEGAANEYGFVFNIKNLNLKCDD